MTDPSHDDPAPHTYVVWRKSQLCLHCSTLHEWSEVYVKTHLHARLHRGKYITNLRPLSNCSPTYNLPVETQLGDLEKIPFCHECPSPAAALSGLPPPPCDDPSPPETMLRPSWVGSASAAPRSRPTTAAKKPTATLDDLFSLLPSTETQTPNPTTE